MSKRERSNTLLSIIVFFVRTDRRKVKGSSEKRKLSADPASFFLCVFKFLIFVVALPASFFRVVFLLMENRRFHNALGGQLDSTGTIFVEFRWLITTRVALKTREHHIIALRKGRFVGSCIATDTRIELYI